MEGTPKKSQKRQVNQNVWKRESITRVLTTRVSYIVINMSVVKSSSTGVLEFETSD